MKERLVHVYGDHQYLKSFRGQHLLNARCLPYRRNVIDHSALEILCKMLVYTKLIFYCYIRPAIPHCLLSVRTHFWGHLFLLPSQKDHYGWQLFDIPTCAEPLQTSILAPPV
jgi:hypothetical protein